MPCVFLEKINLQAEISFRGYGLLLSSCLTPQKVDMQCRCRAAKAVAMQCYCQVLANYAKIFSLHWSGQICCWIQSQVSSKLWFSLAFCLSSLETLLNLKEDKRLEDAIIWTVVMPVNAWFFLDTLSFPSPHRSVMRKTCFPEENTAFQRLAGNTLFGSHVQSLSGSAVVMGCSIVFRLVIRNIDWTRPQLSVNLCREAEDTVSPRRKGR